MHGLAGWVWCAVLLQQVCVWKADDTIHVEGQGNSRNLTAQQGLQSSILSPLLYA